MYIFTNIFMFIGLDDFLKLVKRHEKNNENCLVSKKLKILKSFKSLIGWEYILPFRLVNLQT